MKKLFVVLMAMLLLVACSVDSRLVTSNVASQNIKNNGEQKLTENESKSKSKVQTQQETSDKKGSAKKDVATYRYEKSNGQDHYGHYMKQGKPLGSLGSSWPGMGKSNQPEITKPTSPKYEASKPNKKMHRVVFMNHLDEVIEEKYVSDGASVLAPEVAALEGRHFVGWDYLLTNIKTDLVVRPIYRIERYPVDIFLEDGSYVGRDFFYHGTEIEDIKDYLNLSYGAILGLEEQYYIMDITGDFEVLTESSKVTVKLGIKELNLEYYVDDQLEYSQKLAFGEQIKHPQPQKDKEGYRFISWGEDAPKRAYPHYHGETVRLDAVYEIESFDAKYYINDQEVHAEKVAYNQKPQGMDQKQLEASIPEGYEFVKWDQKIQAIQEDVKYHAILAQKEYTVKIVDSQGNVLSKEKVKHGDAIQVPENMEVKEGYHFVKWSHDGKNIRSDLNIRPIFAINVYTVKFLDEAGNLIQSVKVEHGSDAKAPKIPEKPGWDFLKWSDDIHNVQKDMEVKAIYGRQVKNVTFVDHHGQTLSTVRVEYGEALDQKDIPSGPQRVGYRFVDWDADLDKITDHIIVKPVYEVKTFDVVFKTEEGDVIEKIEVQEGQYPKAPQAPQRAGHHFVSWEPKLTPVQSDQEYVAKYAINQYEVIVLGMDGKELDKKVVEHGQDLEETQAPKQEGYHFVRWDGNFQNITEDRTIRAVYAINEYDVDFVMGDEVVRKVVKHGHTVEYPEPVKREGHRFIRWDKKVDKVTSDLTITAVYESAKYEVIFQDENGRILDKVLVEHGKEAKTDKIPQKEGYEFVAWDIDLSSVTEDGLIAKPKYELKKFDLKFFYKDPYTGEKEYFAPRNVPNASIPYGTDMRSYADLIIKSASYIGFDPSLNLDQLKSIESNAEIEINYTPKDSAVAVNVNVEGEMQTYYVELVKNSPEDVLRYTNEHRRANGVAEMRLREEYLDAAIQRATESAVKFSHLRPFKNEKGDYADASTVFEDIYGIDLSHKVNENLGHTNGGSSNSAVESWKSSPGHNTTMLNSDYKSMISVGVKVDYRAPYVQFGPDYWVQLFFSD